MIQCPQSFIIIIIRESRSGLGNGHNGCLRLDLYFGGRPGDGVLVGLGSDARRLRLAQSAVEFLLGSRTAMGAMLVMSLGEKEEGESVHNPAKHGVSGSSLEVGVSGNW
jgi:hypothetical protein